MKDATPVPRRIPGWIVLLSALASLAAAPGLAQDNNGILEHLTLRAEDSEVVVAGIEFIRR